MVNEMEKIEVTKKFTIDVKRFYLPIKIIRKCPKCETKVIINIGSDEYLSYPRINDKNFELWFYCENCDYEFKKKAILKIQIEVE